MQPGRIAFVTALVSAVGMTYTRTDFESRERVRIQAHFDSVLGELRARDVSSYSSEQQGRRGALIERLSTYRNAGRFPHNYDRPGLVPTFVDPKTDVRCAVAHLVESTGRADIVQRVAAANNHVYVVELSADTAFRHWLRENGLTLAEAARIQVPYMGQPVEAMRPANPYVGNLPAVALSIGSVGLTTWNLARNRHGERKVISVAGIATGALGVIAGNALLGNGQAAPAIARATIWTGLASTVTGAVTMLPVFRASANNVQVSPTITPSEGKSGSRVGIAASFRLHASGSH